MKSNIKKASAEEITKCLDIAMGLSEYFTRASLADIKKDLGEFDTYVYIDDSNNIKAYISVDCNSQEKIEIKQFAVENSLRGNGIGTKLINFTERNLVKGRKIEVKTLDSSSGYRPYESTRSFYEKNGFRKVKVIENMPGWSSGNPCAVYVKQEY